MMDNARRAILAIATDFFIEGNKNVKNRIGQDSTRREFFYPSARAFVENPGPVFGAPRALTIISRKAPVNERFRRR
jgi:hypothetical protein